MAQKKSNRKTKFADPGQLALPFDVPTEVSENVPAAPVVAISSSPTQEIIEPASAISPASQSQPSSHPPTAGQEEHEALRRYSEKALKYEDRALENVRRFLKVAVLIFLAKAGFPVSAMVLKYYDLPQMELGGTLVCGALGVLALVNFTAAVYYALWAREHSYHLEFDYSKLSLAGKIAHLMLRGSVVITLAMFLVVLVLTMSDIISMLVQLHDRFFYVMDGWEPKPLTGKK